MNPSGARIYPGLSVGSEPFWPNRDPASPFPIPISSYKWLVFREPNWDWRTLDMSRASDYADSEGGSDACANSERDKSRFASVPQARRQAPPVAWLERFS